VGDEDGVPFWGTSFVAGPQGELLYEAPTNEEVEVVVDVDMHARSRCVAGGLSSATAA